MNTRNVTNWRAENWPRVNRLREPHEYWQREIVHERPDPETDVQPLGADDAFYYTGSVTPHVLRLVPGDTDSLVEFVGALGIVGLVKWAGGPAPAGIKPGLESWEPLSTAVLVKEPTLYAPDLDAAWTNPHTIEQFSAEHQRLTRAWEMATDEDDPKQALTRELFKAFFQQPYPYELEFAVTIRSGKIVERPRHILARSAFELMDSLANRIPKRCELCTTPFPPNRSDQRYCTDQCARKAYRLGYDKTPYRQEYQKMYRRYKRGTITETDWLAWKQSSGKARS